MSNVPKARPYMVAYFFARFHILNVLNGASAANWHDVAYPRVATRLRCGRNVLRPYMGGRLAVERGKMKNAPACGRSVF